MYFIFSFEFIYAISQKFSFVFLKEKLRTIKYSKVEESIGIFDKSRNFKDIYNIRYKYDPLFLNKCNLEKIYVLKAQIPKYVILKSMFFKTYLNTSLNRKPIYLSDVISLEGFYIFILLIHSRSLCIHILSQYIFCDIFRLLDYLQISETLNNQYFYVNLIQSVVASKIVFEEKTISDIFAVLPNTFLIKNFLILFSHLVNSIKIFNLRDDNGTNKNILNIIEVYEDGNGTRKLLVFKDNDIINIMNNIENIWYRNIFKQFILKLLSLQVKIYINNLHDYSLSQLKLFSELFSVKEMHIEGYYSYIFVPYLLEGSCRNTLIVFYLCGSRIFEKISDAISKLNLLQHLSLISCTRVYSCSLIKIEPKNLFHLKYLDFSRTNITTKEIKQIYHLSQLNKIEMYGSNLVAGTICLLKNCNFTLSLKHLNLSNNFLNGEDISVIFSFSNLYYLDLTGCRLIDFDRIIDGKVTCLNLKYLDLTYVNLNEKFLEILNYFKSLEILIMTLIRFNGIIFNKLNTCYIAETLRELNISQKHLTISDFHKISLMKNLKKLILISTIYQNQENEIYENLNLPNNLQILELRNNDLNNGKVFNFSNQKYLKELDLSLCNLISLDFFENSPFLFENLEKLLLANNSLSETNLNIFKKFKMLKILNISNSNLSNWRILDLKDSFIAKTLEYFDFSGTQISYDDFLAVKSFKNLKFINLFYCKMTFKDLNIQDILFLRNRCSIQIQNIYYEKGYIIFKKQVKN